MGALVLGVDPGKGGAIAAVDPAGGLVFVTPTPMVQSERDRPDYDLPAIVRGLRDADPRVVFVEQLHALPVRVGERALGGSAANFARGLSHGWAWMLTALGIPFVMVVPQTWQRSMLAEGNAGETHQRSIIAAQRLWPAFDFRRTPRSIKTDDGMTDAALLAEYGRRRIAGAGERARA